MKRFWLLCVPRGRTTIWNFPFAVLHYLLTFTLHSSTSITIFFFLFKCLLSTFFRVHHTWSLKFDAWIFSNVMWYFVTKIVLTYCEKKLLVLEKNFWNSRLKAKNLQKLFEITRTIYLKSERSKQFLVTEGFFNFSWKFYIFDRLEQLGFKLEKNIGI